ncbi:reverse transcriptase-like protein [Candidatus Parcubacteria bacterium]|jgi:ribonuclease HI|nr:MAG: reverse transcriptase-like protein [Candidatus Parcubacteria bacterium]
MLDYILYTDGGARGNPGPAAIGYALMQGHKLVLQNGKTVGKATNNVAEYLAVLNGLQAAKQMGIENLECRLDSQLVCEQLNQRYKIKNQDLSRLFVKIWNLTQSFKRLKFVYIPREQNQLADRLVNQALDGKI